MSKENKPIIIYDGGFAVSLQNLLYNTISENDTIEEDTKLKIKDSCKIEKITSDYVLIEHVREKYFEPKTIFELKMVFHLRYNLNKSSDIKITKAVIEKELRNNKETLLRPSCSYASFIFSALSTANFNIPIIDPPYPLEEDVFDNE